MTNRHPSVEAITRFFEYDHLPEPLFNIAWKCAQLKDTMLEEIEDDPELTVGLRKLLEAKDCFVRASLAQVNRRKNLATGEPNNVSEGSPI